MSLESDDQRAVWRAVEAINAAWTANSAAELPVALGNAFREDMVIVAPGFVQRLEGRDACVRSYVDFVDRAEIHDFDVADAAVDVLGDTAVATYRYDIAFTLEGERYDEAGRDLFVFARDGDRWRAAWRTMLPLVEAR